MTRVDVARLRLRAPHHRVQRVQARTEEALRLAAPADERLMVLRRLDLGRLPAGASPAQWAGRAGTQMSALRARAVHAASAGAAGADAVWFASASEARLLLLAELARGRWPSAWFWPLAVPDWRGAAAGPYLLSLLGQARREPQRLVELARGLVGMADLPLLRALTAWIGDAHGVMQAVVEQRADPPPLPDSGARPAPTAIAESKVSGAEGMRRMQRLPAPIRRLLADAAVDHTISFAALRLLAQMALLADTPELAAHPEQLDARVEAVLLVLQAARRAPVPRLDWQADDPSQSRSSLESAFDLPPASPGRKVLPTVQTIPGGGHRPPPQPERLPLFEECGSAAAGVWLLVRPLARMGLSRWLEQRAALAAAGFGRALLRHIVERMLFDADDAPSDPVFAFLDVPMADFDADLLTAWRVGLDRWLRRNVHRRLAGIVRQRGWLRAHATGLDIRFRLAQADLALRLKALDTDPGWVPWLGQQIAYHYRDEALR